MTSDGGNQQAGEGDSLVSRIRGLPRLSDVGVTAVSRRDAVARANAAETN